RLVEAALVRVLHERVGEPVHVVPHFLRDDLVAREGKLRAARDLVDLDLEAAFALARLLALARNDVEVDALLLEARRAEDEERLLALVELHRLHEAREPVEVVAVEVRDEDLLHLHVRDGAALELALRALAAVEEQDLAAALERDRGHVPLDAGPRGARAEEDRS